MSPFLYKTSIAGNLVCMSPFYRSGVTNEILCKIENKMSLTLHKLSPPIPVWRTIHTLWLQVSVRKRAGCLSQFFSIVFSQSCWLTSNEETKRENALILPNEKKILKHAISTHWHETFNALLPVLCISLPHYLPDSHSLSLSPHTTHVSLSFLLTMLPHSLTYSHTPRTPLIPPPSCVHYHRQITKWGR